MRRLPLLVALVVTLAREALAASLLPDAPRPLPTAAPLFPISTWRTSGIGRSGQGHRHFTTGDILTEPS